MQLHDRDGKQARALALMAENPEKSVFDLSLFLKQSGISLSVRLLRIRFGSCDGRAPIPSARGNG